MSKVKQWAEDTAEKAVDKIINELKPTLQNYNMQRCIENKYTIKLMETNLVFLKYENKS